MVARAAGAGLGLLAFSITVFSGMLVQNPITVTLSRSILALFLFCMLGLCLGTVAEIVVREYEHGRRAEILETFRKDTAGQADKDLETGEIAETGVSESA